MTKVRSVPFIDEHPTTNTFKDPHGKVWAVIDGQAEDSAIINPRLDMTDPDPGVPQSDQHHRDTISSMGRCHNNVAVPGIGRPHSCRTRLRTVIGNNLILDLHGGHP
jgi:hypothetical protein